MRASQTLPWVLVAMLWWSSAGAESPEAETQTQVRPAWMRALENDYYKVSLNVRARVEVADFEGLDRSEAYTVRTRAGIGTRSWRGLSAYGELENSFAIDEGEYFDQVETPNGKSPIADPPETGLNQLYLRYENQPLGALQLQGGRQRILLDDERFVGGVGWRQNEQTFDAAWASTSLGVENLRLSYGYVWEVLRIFGDEGPAAMHDFDSASHLVHLSYEGFPLAKLALFTYLLDFDNSAVNSSNSYGIRLTGSRKLGTGPWSLEYAGAYAYQEDAASNPVSYRASYLAADGNVGYDGIGKLGAGYELLGSDGGRARFVTPLATAHKFHGWADAFLDNGGVNGLEDLYAYLAPTLPWGLQGRLVYHRFESDKGGHDLGDELDFVLSKALTPRLTLLPKGAYYDGRSRGPVDRWRLWLELTFNY